MPCVPCVTVAPPAASTRRPHPAELRRGHAGGLRLGLHAHLTRFGLRQFGDSDPGARLGLCSPSCWTRVKGFIHLGVPGGELSLEGAMGQKPKPAPPVDIRFNPTTKIGSKIGEFTYPKIGIPLALTHSHLVLWLAPRLLLATLWFCVQVESKSANEKFDSLSAGVILIFAFRISCFKINSSNVVST